MRQKHLQKIVITLLVLLLPVSVYAIELAEAARQAAKQHNAKVLSAKTINHGNSRTHEIKLLTDKGVVKTVRIQDKSRSK